LATVRLTIILNKWWTFITNAMYLNSTWLSLDYQHLANPAYNADRGPVDIYGGRVHFEF